MVRPRGQSRAPGAETPVFGPSRRLDFELELAYVLAKPLADATPAEAREAVDRIK